MRLSVLPYWLPWSDVDPATHPFDAAEALDVVRGLEPAGRAPTRPEWRHVKNWEERSERYQVAIDWSHTVGAEWTDAMTAALVERYGVWASGWRWSHDEGDLGGGPVGHWCCSLHSITTPDETLNRIATSLCEWRDWLEFLARFFDRYPLPDLPAADRHDAWERATQQLILHSLDRTGPGDAWYAHCRRVLTWFLSRWNVDPDTAYALVEEAIGGRFESWTAPEDTLVTDVAEKLADSLATPPAPDPETLPHHYITARLHWYEDERRTHGR
ncbi:hypothetical protein [Streptomyces sp. G1]|uniref:hypothetical protein n=1 Tax=Streptomyces sp. G1 TaxID=361572 RepID=UPI002030C557|nr:hypothetical protein [Streptomyces sp. G1]MCM1973364.1 hypothetical protein [Streptomyces sp. G1]